MKNKIWQCASKQLFIMTTGKTQRLNCLKAWNTLDVQVYEVLKDKILNYQKEMVKRMLIFFLL